MVCLFIDMTLFYFICPNDTICFVFWQEPGSRIVYILRFCSLIVFSAPLLQLIKLQLVEMKWYHCWDSDLRCPTDLKMIQCTMISGFKKHSDPTITSHGTTHQVHYSLSAHYEASKCDQRDIQPFNFYEYMDQHNLMISYSSECSTHSLGH